VRPQQASELACVVLAGTSEELAGLRAFKGARYRCCCTKWSCGINFSVNSS